LQYMKKAACILMAAMMMVFASCGPLENKSGDPDSGDKSGVSGSPRDVRDEPSAEGSTAIGSSNAKQPGIYPARDNYLSKSKWGYIDSSGMFVIQPSFSQAFRFQPNGRAIAGRGDSVGIIDRAGSFIAEPVYTYINPYSEGLAVAVDQNSHVVLDENGKVISEKYQYIGNYKNGRAVYSVYKQDYSALYGYLDENGKPVIQPVYGYASDFENNRAVVKLIDGQFAIIDRSGNTIRTIEYWDVSGFSDGKAAFKTGPEGKYGYIDSSGNEIIRPSFLYAGGFRNGKAVVSVYGGPGRMVYGLIDESGQFVIEPQYDEILMLGEDRAALGIAKDPNHVFFGFKYALADTDGKLLTDFIFYSVEPFRDGAASATDNTSTYFIDTSGKRMEELPSAEGSGQMEILDGLIYANIDQRMFYMDKKGHLIYKPESGITLDGGVRVSEEKYSPNINYLVYYPVLENMADLKKEADINAKFKEMWTGITTQSIKPSDILDYNYESGFSVEFSRKDLLVLAETGYSYAFGAAHGMPVMNHVHVDVRTGGFYELENLFLDDSNYTGILTEIVRNQITEVSDPDGAINWLDSYEGIKPDHKFYITENGLNLYFDPYEIAPYAVGFPTFMITFDEISSIIDKKGDFWKSFN